MAGLQRLSRSPAHKLNKFATGRNGIRIPFLVLVGEQPCGNVGGAVPLERVANCVEGLRLGGKVVHDITATGFPDFKRHSCSHLSRVLHESLDPFDRGYETENHFWIPPQGVVAPAVGCALRLHRAAGRDVQLRDVFAQDGELARLGTRLVLRIVDRDARPQPPDTRRIVSRHTAFRAFGLEIFQ